MFGYFEIKVGISGQEAHKKNEISAEIYNDTI